MANSIDINININQLDKTGTQTAPKDPIVGRKHIESGAPRGFGAIESKKTADDTSRAWQSLINAANARRAISYGEQAINTFGAVDNAITHDSQRDDKVRFATQIFGTTVMIASNPVLGSIAAGLQVGMGVLAYGEAEGTAARAAHVMQQRAGIYDRSR